MARRASAFHAPAGDRFDLAWATLTPLLFQRGGPGAAAAAAGKRRRGEQWARSGRRRRAPLPPPVPPLSRPLGSPRYRPGTTQRPDGLPVPQLRPGRRRAWAPAAGVGEGRRGVGGWGAGPGGTFAGARRFPASPQPARAGSPHQCLPKPINAWHRLSNRLTNPAPPIAGRPRRALSYQG